MENLLICAYTFHADSPEELKETLHGGEPGYLCYAAEIPTLPEEEFQEILMYNRIAALFCSSPIPELNLSPFARKVELDEGCFAWFAPQVDIYSMTAACKLWGHLEVARAMTLYEEWQSSCDQVLECEMLRRCISDATHLTKMLPATPDEKVAPVEDRSADLAKGYTLILQEIHRCARNKEKAPSLRFLEQLTEDHQCRIAKSTLSGQRIIKLMLERLKNKDYQFFQDLRTFCENGKPVTNSAGDIVNWNLKRLCCRQESRRVESSLPKLRPEQIGEVKRQVAEGELACSVCQGASSGQGESVGLLDDIAFYDHGFEAIDSRLDENALFQAG